MPAEDAPDARQAPLPKLVIMIPCFNEEAHLPTTLACLPRALPGVGAIEVLVVDDGSTDRTVEVAKDLGVQHVVSLPWNMGLARAFMAGALSAVDAGADLLVNLDADNQYSADDIPRLLDPLLRQEADIVVGERPIDSIQHFSWLKKHLQRFGSMLVRWLSATTVRDSPSGFRALTRRAILRTNIFNRFTYTHEMLIGSGRKGLRVVGVPIRVNPGQARPSRLFKSIRSYVYRSGVTIVRMYYVYAPGRFFTKLAAVFGLVAAILVGRFFWFYFHGRGDGWIQSLVIAAIAATFCGLSAALAVVGDMININRLLLEDIQFMLRDARSQERSRRT
jgi:glycosyltransferase involved in cell wall biosynthesis